MSTKSTIVNSTAISKLVDQRKHLADLIDDEVTARTREMEHALASRLAPVLNEDESLPDLGIFLRLIQRMMMCQKEELAVVEAALAQERKELAGWRGCRKAASATLHVWLQRVCAIWGGIRSPLLQELRPSFPDKVASHGEALLAQGERLLAALRAFEVRRCELASQPKGGIQIDLERLTDDLDVMVTQLRTALVAVASGVERVAALVACKREAMAEFDRVFGATMLIFQGLFALAEQHDLCQYLRPRLPAPRLEHGRRRSARSLASLFP